MQRSPGLLSSQPGPGQVSAQDPVAALIASVVAVLGALGLLTRWGLSADEVAQIGGAALALAAAIRMFLDARKPASSAVATVTVPVAEREFTSASLPEGHPARAADRPTPPERPIVTLDVRGPEDSTRRLTEDAPP